MFDSHGLKLKDGLALAGLILLGIAGNHFNVSLLFGVDFLFGGIAVLIVLSLYGILWGTVAALMAGGYTYFLWGHPSAAVIFALEALFVGFWLRSGRRNLLLLDSLFWLCIGMPAAWFFGYVVLSLNAIATSFIMFKLCVNGLFNALLATLALNHWPVLKLLERFRKQRIVTLKETLFNFMVALVIFPSLLIMFLHSRDGMEKLEADNLFHLEQKAAFVANHLRCWYRTHLNAVTELARQAEKYGVMPSQDLQNCTEVLKKAMPNFHNMYVADAEGTTIAFYPAVNENGESTIGLNFADRDYFKQLQASKRPVMSQVFTGRGGVFSPIVTLSVPILSENHLRGFALAAINLEQIGVLLNSYRKHKHIDITLADKENRVIVSTLSARRPMQVLDLKARGTLCALRDSAYLLSPQEGTLTPMQRWKASFYVWETVIAKNIPWKLIIEIPVAPLQARLYQFYLQDFSIISLLVVIFMFPVFLLSRWIVRPLSKLASVTTDLPGKLMHRQDIEWPESSLFVTHQLIRNFKPMVDVLKENFRELQDRGMELEKSNHALKTEIKERRRVEAALRDSEEKYRLLVENMTEMVVKFDAAGKLLFVSPSYCETFGKSEDELIGNMFMPLVHEDDRGLAAGAMQRLLKPPYSAYEELRALTTNGSRWQSWTGKAVLDRHENVTEMIGVGRDIAARKQAEERIETSLKEKEVLLREIYHRTKNNMQVISALLTLQSANIKDENVLTIFRETKNRINSMALVHQNLYRSKNLSRINLKNYLQDLSNSLLASCRTNPEQIALKLELEDVFLSIDTAVPCGLMINELISNALKHAFPGGRKGEISIKLHTTDTADIEIRVSDNGVGLPENMNLSEMDSVGLQLVNDLGRYQLNGKVELMRGRGAEFLIAFKECQIPERI